MARQKADGQFVARLRRLAADMGVVALGITSAAPFTDVGRLLSRRHARGRKSYFEPHSIEERINPEQILPGTQSIISIALSYHAGAGGEPVRPPRTSRIAPEHRPRPHPLYDDRRREAPVRRPRGEVEPKGWITRHAWGRDYHRVVREHLDELAEFIGQAYPGSQCAGFVDTGPPVDRAIAQRAGVGWIGKNCCVIVPEVGSWVVLGSLLTTVALPPDEPAPPPFQECADCDLCLQACPTGALVGPGDLDPDLCLAEVVVRKGSLPLELREPMGNRIYGCDTCQQVCPYNRDVPLTGSEAFLPVVPWDTEPDLMAVLALTKGEFRRTYGRRASGWRGKTVIQRNAVYALGNYKDPATVPHLGKILHHDVRPAVRGAAAWALGRIGNKAARRQLARAKQAETEAEVQQEIDQALAAALPVDEGAEALIVGGN